MKGIVNFMKHMFAALLAIPVLILDTLRVAAGSHSITLLGVMGFLTYAGCPAIFVDYIGRVTLASAVITASLKLMRDEDDKMSDEFEAVQMEALSKLLTFARDIKNIFNVVRNWFRKSNNEESETKTFNRMQKKAYREVRNMIITMYMRSIKILWNRGATNKLAVIVESPIYLLEIISIKLGILPIGSFYENWMNNCEEEFTKDELHIIFPEDELDLMDRLCDIGLGEIPPMDLLV